MKKAIIFFALFFISFLANAQAKIISGKVIDYFDLAPVPLVRTYTRDTVQIGIGDANGNFKIELASGTNELLFGFLGMERTFIKIPNDCKQLEIIMIPAGTYDFMSISKVNRIHYREFKNLKNKHRQAYEKGIFISDTPCFVYVFNK